MKKLNIFAGLALGLVALVAASCDSDRDNNPILPDLPTENAFTLNTPAYANANVDLATSSNLTFTWSQPDYGFPAAAEYQMQFSVDNTWTTSVDSALADETGTKVADYANVGNPENVVKASIPAADLAKALEQIKQWPDGEVPASLQIYARCMATYGGKSVYSNVVPITVLPYYVELKSADPIIYYLVGGCIADGKWTNSAAAIGTSMIPMLPVPGTTFDKVTGAGQIEWYGYIPAGGEFKIVFTPGDWDNGICGGGSAGKTTLRIGGGDDPGNITVAEDGYYHIVVNTQPETSWSSVTCKIEKMATAPAVYTSMAIPGSENGWNAAEGDVMTALNTADNNKAFNHDWVKTVTYKDDAASDGGCKFAANGAWDVNWGATDFPYGTGTNGGDNIPFKAGTYQVFFNDISGTYYFMSQSQE